VSSWRRGRPAYIGGGGDTRLSCRQAPGLRVGYGFAKSAQPGGLHTQSPLKGEATGWAFGKETSRSEKGGARRWMGVDTHRLARVGCWLTRAGVEAVTSRRRAAAGV
jgi:hypothetical protein